MILRMSTENFRWLCLIVSEIFTFKKWEAKNLFFILVVYAYIAASLNILKINISMDRSLNKFFRNTQYTEVLYAIIYLEIIK